MKTRIFIVVILGVVVSACSKSDGGGESGVPTPSPVAGSVSGTGTQPYSSSSGYSPIASDGVATLVGLPGNPSKVQTLSVTVDGLKVTGFRYAVVSGSTQCTGATFSPVVAAGTPIGDDLGADGVKTLCVVAISDDDKGVAKATPLYYSWLKDTAAPTASFTLAAGAGPAKQAGTSFVFAANAIDADSGLAAVHLSLSNGSACLNGALSSFDAPCPTPLPMTAGVGNGFQLAIDKAVFSGGTAYTASLFAADLAGNTSAATDLAFTWDTTVPAAPASLAATAGQEQVSLSWAAVGDATLYVIMRRAGGAVSVLPAVGEMPVAGDHLGGGNFVACVTASTSCVDEGLEPYMHHHYQALAYDSATNRSTSGPRASAQPDAKPAFLGVSRVALASPGRRITAEWQRFTPAGVNAASVSYGVHTDDAPGDQSFASAAASITNQDGVTFTDAGSSTNLYVVARQSAPSAPEDKNTRELRLKLSAGTHHKLAASGRFAGQDPLGQVFLRSAWAVAMDPFGNVVFGGAPGTLNVICREATQAYYCRGRMLDKIYTFAGTDGTDDGADGALASFSAMGEANGLAFDAAGNLFIADNTNFRVRAICYAPLAAGFCNGKTIGFVYHVAGTGSSVDGLDDGVAKTTGIGQAIGVALDSRSNLYIADATFRKLRVVCHDTTAGACSGRVAGFMYNFAGTGVAGDANDALPALAANFGALGALTSDTRGNLFFSDTTNFRIRAFCQDVTGTGHFCSGKTVGYVYRVTGLATGAITAADGGHNVAANTNAAQIGPVNGLAVSPAGNIYIADNFATGNRLRVVCYENTTDAPCVGATVGNFYRFSGNSLATDGASNSLAAAVAIGSPRGLARDASGNFVFADPTNRRIRLHCTSTSALCTGRLADYHYQLVGAGASSLGWNLDAMATPMGLPQGLAEDTHGNLYLSDATNFVARVICYDTAPAGFCYNKTAGHSYIIAGNGATGNGADAVLAVANQIGTITGVEVDTDGNVYLADNTNRTIRVVCGTTTGVCAGRTVGYMYRHIGNTTTVDTTDNVAAVSNGLGQPADIALDNQGNVWIADAQYFRIRLFCRTTTGICAGRTAGNIYRIAGNGVTGNAADAALASPPAAAFGTLTAIDVDPWNNVIIGDSGAAGPTNMFVRVYCNNALGGYCAGKTTPTGRIYRAMGTGTSGDGLNDTAAAATAISVMNAVQSDDMGNIYVAESTNRRVRVLCVDSTDNYCLGLTVGNTYRMIGTAAAGDASSGTSGAVARIDTPSRDSLLFTASGKHLVYVGGGTPAGLGAVRVFLGY